MHSRLVFIGGFAAAGLLAAACGNSSTGSNPYGAPAVSPSTAPVAAPSAYPTPIATPPAAPAASGTTIAVGTTRLGQILVDGNGRTLYLFLADSGSKSACNSAACVQYWPPVLTTGAPQASTGANASLLGTTTRQDGTTEVTYAGHPLYYFVSDKKAGDVSGQGINGFGAPWYVVSPSGMQIR
jgi:predicted lipoprotein with Yx(FWY)xxD motif